jgi:hypothetical protein
LQEISHIDGPIIGKLADFPGFAPFGRKADTHAVKIKNPRKRVGEARSYSFLIGIDPHCWKRRQSRHIPKRSAQRVQFAALDLVGLAQLSAPEVKPG